MQGATSFQKAYQRADKRSVNQDYCPAASATTTPNDVMITASEHQQWNSIEFCPPFLQWQHEQCQHLAYNVQPRPVQYTEHRLTGNDLAIRDVRCDGNCLFRALALAVTGNEQNHMLVCQGLVAYMRQHRNSVKHYIIWESDGNSLDEDFEAQMCEMENNGTWGTQAEIISAASMFQTNIHMYQRRQNRSGVIREWHTYRAEMLLQCRSLLPNCSLYLNHTGNHYNVVIGNQNSLGRSQAEFTEVYAKQRKIDENNNTISTEINANDASDYCNSFQADTCFTASSVLKKCRNCGKTLKNLKLHLTKKPMCKNLYDLSSIEAESAVRTKRRQSLYKQQNQLQISEKKKNYRENNRDIIEKYNNENKEKIREKQKNYNRENKEKIQEKQEKYNCENNMNMIAKTKITLEQNKTNTIRKTKGNSRKTTKVRL